MASDSHCRIAYDFLYLLHQHLLEKLLEHQQRKDYRHLVLELASAVAGVQEVFQEGAGEASKESRTQYGNVNLMPQELIQGNFSNFAQKDAPANKPMLDPMNQSGTMDLEVSATRSPNKDTDLMAVDKLEERLNMYAKAGSNAGFGNNNRSQTMRLG